MKIKNISILSIINFILLIAILLLLAYSNINLTNQNKILEENLNLMNIRLDSLSQKISNIEDTNILNSLTLDKILAGNLTEADKLCEKLRNIKIERAYYKENILFVKINNENNQNIAGFSFNLINNKINNVDSNESIKAYEIKEYTFNLLNITKVVVIPKILTNNIELCDKEIISDVKKFFDINGNFNVSALFIASGQEKNISILTTIVQEENIIMAQAKVLKETGEYGESFNLAGELIEDKLTLSGKDIIIPAGSISGVNQDVKADIYLNGIVISDGYIEGKKLGDTILNIKDAIPGVTITVEGSFKANKI